MAEQNVNSNRSVGAESNQTRSTFMSEEEQSVRRKEIKDIMRDSTLSQTEKNKMIQGLMDGRRRSSACSRSVYSGQDSNEPRQQYVSSMARAARLVADIYASDDDGDTIMSEAPDNIYNCDDHDHRSVASSISAGSDGDLGDNGLPAGMTYRQLRGRSLSLQEWNEDARVAAVASANTLFSDNPAHMNRLLEQSRPPCNHYERNCTIISPCCGLAFGCRICHDECPVLPPPNYARDGHGLSEQMGRPQRQERRRSMPLEYEEEEENHHLINRFGIREVICRQCFTRQSSKTDNCKTCGIQFGAYHCSICNLWMSDTESPYHCAECGFCRVGGRENFRHCRDCGMCIDTLLFDDHNCKAGKYNSNCPVCQEDLFSSRQASHEMPCGHAIHWHCFKELTAFDTRCPVCKKTAETPEQMASTWSALAMGIALQPVPPDLARVVNIYCNDCEEKDYERRWHFLGVRCMHCLSFNTNVEQILLQGREAADFLDQQEAARGEETGGVPPTISALSLAVGENDAMDEDVAPGGQDTSSGTGSTEFDNRRSRMH